MVSKRKNSTSYRQSPSNRANRGFSLIELLIVVAVILIIMAIAIPNFIQSKMRANESAAVQNLRNISTAEVVYSTTYEIGFSPDLISLGGTSITVDKSHAGLIDDILAGGQKSGYVFTYTVLTTDSTGDATSYSINADPIVQGNTGVRHFYTDQTSVIRANATAAAGPTDAPLQ